MLSNKKNYLLNLVSNYGATFTTIIIGFILPPLSLNYWKVEKYGIWALVTSVVFYLSVTSLGIENSASVLMAKSPKFSEKLKILKRSFVLLISAVLIGLGLFLLLNHFYKDWIRILGKIPPDLMKETYSSIVVFALFYFLNWPFSLIASAFSGFQKLYIDNIFRIFGSFVNLISLLIVIALHGSLVTFAFSIGLLNLGINLSKLIFFFLFVFLKKKRESVENRTDVSHEISTDSGYKVILSTGVRLTLFGIATLIINNADNFIISNLMGVRYVTPFSLTSKLFIIMINISSMFYGSISPILGKEFAGNNWNWLNKTYNYFLAFTILIGGMMWLGGILFFKDFIHIWVGPEGFAGIAAVFFLGMYCYLSCMVSLNNFMIISFNYTKGFAFIGWAEAVLHIIFVVLLSHKFGLTGVTAGAALGSLVAQTWLSPLLLKKRSQSQLKFDISLIIKHFVYILLPFIGLSLLIQLNISSVLIKIMCGVMLVFIYIIISYRIFPKETRRFIINQFYSVINKLKFNLLKKYNNQ
jgi:O-antigen/teichoic acid export membrane protein